ncbi:hypothetical protein HXX01_02135 [Candidatus Nomurabacteria bacterium]|nr:hypothetical protein [Candidatus Nomurabacteria bacterium]
MEIIKIFKTSILVSALFLIIMTGEIILVAPSVGTRYLPFLLFFIAMTTAMFFLFEFWYIGIEFKKFEGVCRGVKEYSVVVLYLRSSEYLYAEDAKWPIKAS